ncbi:hypothetical protein RV11_GL003502 [Enterococcus phoeniculicola]|uniref:HK97 gp10 family phage protein n=1 Tax=Enterococcus phoeniculicola ATCC BAA-412 TaxID=1158610 RepID=R3WJG5_9ENTE|nr:hypothetical protein [Enterococcus phoeniculicola]EOL42000.1 hypothetical protein UC3_02348 [Enterococcus phoeniculicola ATCC BAA-412]EOT79721.1 hypothetical protein I589_01233 [Enterococcus phoeniculicola ATCC BAA-412]OJG71781.1 hypothetical protein RV11_GL003502 [Enterococcus phoeniculicola]
MSVTIKGEAEIIKNIEAKLGKSKATRVINKALRTAGEKNKGIVKEAVSSYIDSGRTHDLVITSGVKSNPKRVETGWASKERAPLVHLNEFGYTRFGKYVRPRGMGKLQGAVDKIESTAMKEMRSELGELVK